MPESSVANCNICGAKTSVLFQAMILGKHDVSFHRCASCKFIQTDTPFWLEESYSSAISTLDVGLVARNVHFSKVCTTLIEKYYPQDERFLDYGGGYGLFVRLMRDSGFDFYWHDEYCENIFARYFEYSLEDSGNKFELITAFEVMEHLPNPMETLTKILSLGDSFLFSTHLQPEKEIHSADDWWYFLPDTGQHLSFYTTKTMVTIAEKFGMKYYSDGSSLHLFTRLDIDENDLKVKRHTSDGKSLLQNDAEIAKLKLPNFISEL